MRKVSFEGIGEVAATFACGTGVQEGQVVKLTGNGAVDACEAAERFCGVALCVNDAFASVQVGGLARVSAGTGVTAGWVKLSADGTGGVQKDDTAGAEYLVVSVDGGKAMVRL